MNPELIYFLKVNFAMVVFYGFYKLLSNNDTFFRWRRVALLSFLVISFLHPFLNIQNWVKQHEPMVALADIYATRIRPELSFSSLIIPQQIPQGEEVAMVQQETNWLQLLPTIIYYGYIGIALILFLRLLIQFFSLIRLRYKTHTANLKDTKVHILNNENGPFSFFKWIFINPEIHTEDEINEIMIHEKTHVRQWHSIDVVFSELLCILCWFNPFMWLIKREIRINLEYLADNKVLETGHDCRIYQYHLLGLVHNNKQVATLYNNFNVLPLKNRIKMMNKKRSRQIGRAKYFIFPLLAAALLLISNIEAVARTTERVVEKITVSITESSFMVDQQDPVFEVVDKLPQFPGGQAALMQYLNRNIKYPVEAAKNKKEGRVIIQYVVGKDGSINNPVIVRSVDPELDAEALRVISSMPKWTPGENKGEIVSVKYTIPVVFSVQGGEKKQAPPPPPMPKEVKAEKDANGVYIIADKMPSFQGGQTALMKYINERLKYPVSAVEEKKQGRVIVQFIVGADGSINDPVVVRSVDPALDREALRVINSMPKWIPAQHDGEAVRCKYTIPVQFMLP